MEIFDMGNPETGGDVLVVFEFGELSDITGRLNNSEYRCKLPGNRSHITNRYESYRSEGNYVEGAKRQPWAGAHIDQCVEWCKTGYKFPGIAFQDSDIAPLRERPKWQFNDYDGDFDFEIFWSGQENCYRNRSKRPKTPTIAINAELAVNCDISPKRLIDYAKFILKLCMQIEASSIDYELTVSFTTRNPWDRECPGILTTRVRCKRLNEASDFLAWSAMLSPAGYRILGFNSWVIASDIVGRHAKQHLGHACMHSADYRAEYDEVTGALKLTPSDDDYVALDENRLMAEVLDALDMGKEKQK